MTDIPEYDLCALTAEVYEDLQGWVSSVSLEGDDGENTVVLFECDYWANPRIRLSFKIQCLDSLDTSVIPGPAGDLFFTDRHPLLFNHNASYGHLYFSTAPTIPHEVIGILYETHEGIFLGNLPISDYLNPNKKISELLKHGNGLLAEGPIPVLEKYRSALSCKLKTNILATEERHGSLKILLFDSQYIICSDAEVTRQEVIAERSEEEYREYHT